MCLDRASSDITLQNTAREVCQVSNTVDYLGQVKQLKARVATDESTRKKFSAEGLELVERALGVPGAAERIVREAVYRNRKNRQRKPATTEGGTPSYEAPAGFYDPTQGL